MLAGGQGAWCTSRTVYPIGPLPVNDLALRVGRRELDLAYPKGKHARYALVVEPDQHIRVVFPVPPGMVAPTRRDPLRSPVATALPSRYRDRLEERWATTRTAPSTPSGKWG
jgi:hypothetical protein